MKHLTTAALLALLASPAAAHQCPADMAAVDAALQTASLSAADLAKVKQLRAEGEALHKAGSHAASVKALAQAKALLGL
ncbi:hypothetical protein [Marinovum sp.]|uniref:hypothetical protein n=1 Tax=Marinovum sp. TaxID=2024839 RepID=UPI002B26CEF2|nr:hypothetical protein [Marinovum sp.]